MSEPFDRLHVGPYTYSVRWDAALVRSYEHDKNAGYAGYTDHAKLLFVLDPDLPPSYLRETAWHEAKHCVAHLFGWEDALKEEEAIRRTAPMELAVLRDNPAFAIWLLEAEP